MSTRLSLGSSRRPLSAIFIGDSSLDQATHSKSQLPSPPSTQGSADGSLRAKSRADTVEALNLRPTSRASMLRQKEGSSSDDDDDGNNEDHTARLSNEQRPNTRGIMRPGSRSAMERGNPDPTESDNALNRAQSLYARNRQVLSTMTSASSNGRLNTPSPRPFPSKSPIPRPQSRTSPSSRTGYNRPRNDTVSGSETERERQSYSPDEHSTPPTSATRQSQFDDSVGSIEDTGPSRQSGSLSRASRRSPGQPYNSASVSRRRGTTILDVPSSPEAQIFHGALAAAVNDIPTSLRTSPHRRNPLPREFRASLDGYSARSELEASNPHRPESRERSFDYTDSPSYNRPASREYAARPGSVANLRTHQRDFSRNANPFDARPSTSAAGVSGGALASSSSNRSMGRFNTLRERRTPSHYRWASEDVHSPEDDTDPQRSNGDGPRWRYQSRGGSAESALAGDRALAGETADQRRADDADDGPPYGEQYSRNHNGRAKGHPSNASQSNGVRTSSSSSVVSDQTTQSQAEEMRRDRIARLTGIRETPERRPESRSGNSAYNVRQPPTTNPRAYPTRPATSIDPSFYDDRHPPRTAPPQLRSYKSTYTVPDRERRSPLPPLAIDRNPPPNSSRDHDEWERASSTVPSSSSRRIDTLSTTPAPEHTVLLQQALNTFESNLRRVNIHPTAASGCVAAADTLARAASILNTLLRTNADRALEEQIEAEVGDSTGGPDAELWRHVGAEFKESVKISDEIVRTMTAFLLDVGKVMRDVASSGGTSAGTPPPGASPRTTVPPAASTSGSNPNNHGYSHMRTMSLDEEALASRRSDGGSADGRSNAGSGSAASGPTKSRRSVDGMSASSSGRRSLDRHGSDFSRRGTDESIRERNTGSLRRTLTSRRSDAAYDQQRASSSFSATREESESERLATREFSNAPTPGLRPKEDGLRVKPHLSIKRLLPNRRPQTSPADSIPSPLNGRMSSTDVDSPTSAVRSSFQEDRPRRAFPPLAVPPPLSTLPSESSFDRRRGQRLASGTILPSRHKTSTGSTATVRGAGARFPSLTSPSKPTTQVTPTTVSTGVERDPGPIPGRLVFPERSTSSRDIGTRASNAATISAATSREVYSSVSEEHDGRDRTLSNHSTSEISPPPRHSSDNDSNELDDWQVGSVATVVARDTSSVRRYGSVRDRPTYAQRSVSGRRTVTEIFN